MSKFVHTHVHTHYSLLDGAIQIGPLLERAKEFGMDAVAITDHGVMHGALDFFKQATKAGIKPIIGCECYVAPRSLTDRDLSDREGTRHLVLLARNNQGYKNLCRLASIAQLEGFYYKPRIDKEVLKKYSDGLIALSACLKGEIPQLLLSGRTEEAEKAALWYQNLFGEGNFYLEVQNNGIDLQDRVNAQLLEMSKKLSIPLVATNDCHYLNKADADAHEVLLCIQTGKTMDDPDRFRFETNDLYFKSPDEMADYFADYPGAIENTVEIARRCEITFDLDTYHFPKFDAESDKTPDELIDEQVRSGYAKRMEVLKSKNPDLDEAVYNERLEYELKTIKDMGFPGYFLIVADFIRYARENDVPVGPGRGSAAGSLVSYSMGITDLDPIEHGLIFERFLNPARISMPDIDVDFCIHGREKVYNYVVQRYGGGDYVAQIITFGKMKAKMVVRDVGRAMGFSVQETDTLAKLIPDELKMTIAKAIEKEPKIAEQIKDAPKIAQWIRVSKALEGLARHASTHAAGVVIGDKPLYEYLPLFKGKNGEVVTQWAMKDVEDIGLVKFDFLGLRNLTVIDSAIKMIEQQGKTPPDLSNLPFNDKKTFDLLQAGDTTGVFQLESSGMKSLMIRLRPESFAELTALVALYRPGPLDSGMVDDFVERKHGRKKVEYLFPQLEPILKETYGVMVYQEQVMQAAGALAGYSMADADSLRKAIGKKIEKLMAEHREKFVSGCVANNLDKEKATHLFDLIEKFGGYGFNKSHSAAYALIAYQTAYLKAHYPVEFMAALLTSEIDTIDGVVKFINECKTHNIEVQAPDINASRTNFTVDGDKILFGLAAIKNVGSAAVNLIIMEREKNGHFPTLFDFCSRVDTAKVNKRVLENLIRCGAFDSTGVYRSRLLAVLEEAFDYGQCVQKERNSQQISLFGDGSGGNACINEPFIPAIAEWDAQQKLKFEKEALGFYVTGHPLDEFKETMDLMSTTNAEMISDKPDGRNVRFGGSLKAVKTIWTKKNDQMAFIELEDYTGTLEVVVFPSVFQACRDLLIEDALVMVEGKVQSNDSDIKVLADSVNDLTQSDPSSLKSDIHINLDSTRVKNSMLPGLRDILKKYPGSRAAYVHISIPDKGAEAVIRVSRDFLIRGGLSMAKEVNSFLGYDAVL